MVGIADPGDDGLKRAGEIVSEGLSQCFDVSCGEEIENPIESCRGLLARSGFSFSTKKILFGDHLQNGTDVLSHAAMDEHERVLQRFPSERRYTIFA